MGADAMQDTNLHAKYTSNAARDLDLNSQVGSNLRTHARPVGTAQCPAMARLVRELSGPEVPGVPRMSTSRPSQTLQIQHAKPQALVTPRLLGSNQA